MIISIHLKPGYDEQIQSIPSLSSLPVASNWHVKGIGNWTTVSKGPTSKLEQKSILFWEKLFVLSKVFNDISVYAFDLLTTFLNESRAMLTYPQESSITPIKSGYHLENRSVENKIKVWKINQKFFISTKNNISAIGIVHNFRIKIVNSLFK
jgi:hypothetical protein